MIKDDSVTKIITTEVLSVHKNQNLSDVNKIFRENMLHHVPVMDGRKPVGIISSTDIFKLLYDIEIQDDRMIDAILDHNFKIENVMTKDLVTLPITSTIKEVAKVLKFSTIHSILITNKKNELEGIVTTTDLVEYLYDNIK